LGKGTASQYLIVPIVVKPPPSFGALPSEAAEILDAKSDIKLTSEEGAKPLPQELFDLKNWSIHV